MSDKSMLDEPFVTTLTRFKNEGRTANERMLADLCLSIYEVTKWHEPVIQIVNQLGAKAVEEVASGTD